MSLAVCSLVAELAPGWLRLFWFGIDLWADGVLVLRD